MDYREETAALQLLQALASPTLLLEEEATAPLQNLQPTPPPTPLEEECGLATAQLYNPLQLTPPLTPLEGLATDQLQQALQSIPPVEDDTGGIDPNLEEFLSLLQGTQLPPPTPPSDEMLDLDELLQGLFNEATPATTTPAKRCPPAITQQCPVPGCHKSVRRVWNHLFEYHKKKGTHTGKFTYKSMSTNSMWLI